MTTTLKAGSVRGATTGIAKQLGLSPKSVRKAVQEARLAMQHARLAESRSHIQLEREGLFSQIRIGGTDSQFSRLTYNGMLPVFLPNGIRLAILPDMHAPAHHKGIMSGRQGMAVRLQARHPGSHRRCRRCLRPLRLAQVATYPGKPRCGNHLRA